MRNNFFCNRYIQEGAIFFSMFILTMLHEWISINSMADLINSLGFFGILYTQAQINKFYIFSFFFKKKRKMFFFLITTTTLIGASLLFIFNYLWFDPVYYQNANTLLSLTYLFVICLVCTLTIMTLSLMHQYSVEIQRKNQEQLLLSEIKIQYLSSQLNPHSFFNMLNNLYGVSLTEPNRTHSLILKLSELMRYQIENAGKSIVTLEDEISFIRNFVGMEKERVGNRCKIIFKYKNEAEADNHYYIVPLILIILVENAFKHSINNKKWFVSIYIKLENDQLSINIRNSLSDIKLNYSSGIGLQNISQRLDFFYQGNYELFRSQSGQMYQSILILQLKK
jgi:two-component system LytT family sensor kinase